VAAFVSLVAVTPQASAVTPIPGRLWIISDDSGNRGDLFRTNTSNEWVRLTNGLSVPESVSADPKGRFATLCAARAPTSPYRIYRVGANGGALKNLSGKRPGCSPSVSPDGRKVAFLSYGYRPGEKSRIYVVRATGGRPKLVYEFCGGCITEGPFWGGKRLYFERTITRNPAADREIYSIRARDGKKLRKHTRGGSNLDYRVLDVSRDGRKLLGVIYNYAVPNFNIAEFSPAGAVTYSFRIANDDLVGGGTFAPSASRVAFAAQPAPGDPSRVELFTIGSPFGAILPNPGVSSTGPYAIDWSKRP